MIIKKRSSDELSTIAACSSIQKSMFMNKLITNLAARFPDLTEGDISLSVETIIDAMSSRLISGGRIELRGFGSFSLNAQISSASRDPMLETNAEVVESPLVIFKPGQVISERINNIG